MEIKTENICLFCRTILNNTDEVNIQLNITKEGQINIEEFIKNSLLNLQMQEDLDSCFICLVCLELINELEGYFIKSKKIQDALVRQFHLNKASKEEIEGTDSSFIHAAPCTSEKQIVTRTKRSSRKQNIDYIQSESDHTQEDVKDSPSRTTKNVKNERKAKTKCVESSNITIETNDIEVKDATRIYCCEKCGKEYSTYSGFRMHVRKHNNENKFRCEICNKTFTQKICLQRHNNIHEGIRPYECDICGKTFIHMKSHKIHMDIHSGNRNVQCDVCGRGFLTSSHLVRHMRIHTKEKPFPCPECGKPFAEKYNMKQHAKTHEKASAVVGMADN